jgi:hypothetical protein
MDTKAAMARARRLFSLEAIPGWILFLWRVVEAAGDVDFLVSAWNRGGDEVLDIAAAWGWLAGIAWLAAIIVFGSPLRRHHPGLDRDSSPVTSQEERDQLASRLAIVYQTISLEHLRDSEPCVVFTIHVFNGSRFAIIFDRELNGEVYLNDKPLQLPAVFDVGTRGAWPSGHTARLRIRQPVTEKTAENILSHNHIDGCLVEGFSLASLRLGVRAKDDENSVLWTMVAHQAGQKFIKSNA